MNKKIEMVNLLLDTIDSGLMNAETIGYFTYSYLEALFMVTYQLDNGTELYLGIKKYLENINLQRLRAQIRMRKKIRVGFIANYASTWIGEELYRLLERSGDFEPYVFLMANHVPGQSDEEILTEYREQLEYFQTRDVRVIQTLDFESGVQYTWEQIGGGGKPQLCIWLTPWTDLFRGQFHLRSYSMDIIHTYIPYGITVVGNEKGEWGYEQCNQLLHNTAWKIFRESRISADMAGKYSFIKGENVVYTGYPKMDAFYEETADETDQWNKVIKKAGNPKAKRIIYAPHHTIGKNEVIHFSTFASNYIFMLELAEKYQDETVWIFKPHPQLKYKAVREGIFADMEEWKTYEQRWKKLRNAEVMEDGLYHNLFKGSDAMILDSVSFMAEYLYVHKPLLRLSREEQYFNDFGKQLIKVHYSAEGTDRKAIENFVENVVLAGNDEKKNERELFFEENLDYWKEHGRSAAANIYAQLEKIKGMGQ